MCPIPNSFRRSTLAIVISSGLLTISACEGEIDSDLLNQITNGEPITISAAGQGRDDEHHGCDAESDDAFDRDDEDDFDVFGEDEFDDGDESEDEFDEDEFEVEDLDEDEFEEESACDDHDFDSDADDFDEDHDHDEDHDEDHDTDTDTDHDSDADEAADSDEDTDSGHGNGAGHGGAGADGSMHVNHCEMIPAFAGLSQMTHTATQSGAWSNSATWGGVMPADGASVHIPEGVAVRIGSEIAARMETVRVDGVLDFATDQNTLLPVDTLVSTCSGALLIGSENQPVQPDVTARVLFIDDGPVADPQMVSRGAILMGETKIHGAAKTHRATITPHARQGDRILNLGVIPSGWQIGDQLIITGTLVENPASDEIRQISAINGRQVSLDRALDLDHTAPKSDLNVYVANASRNVEFVSESQAIQHRGHIMLMSLNVDIRNARFTELGRTDKSTELNDFQFNFHDGGNGDDAPATADVIALGGSNIRGRYAIHFHQAGIDPASTPARVMGSVAFNGPGWGFVNHSSNVDFIDNVSYGFQGAGFYTEAGNEIGSMRGNIAIRSVNPSFSIDFQGAIDPDLRAFLMDYGNDGDGYWLTGTRVSLIDNVAAGASAHGFIYWTDGIMEPTSGTTTRVTVPVGDLPNGRLIPGRETVPVWWAPLAEVRNNESYGSTVGFRIRYVHAKTYLGRDEESDFHRSPPQAYIDTLNPTINDLTVWGSRDGVLLNYNERMSLINARIIGFGKDISQFSFNEGTAKSGIGFDIGNDVTQGPGRVENVRIEGFGMGMATPVNGRWQMRNLTFVDNNVDLLVQPPENGGAEVRLQSTVFDTFEVYEQDVDRLPSHIVVVD